MRQLLLLLLIVTIFCQNDTFIGYLSIKDRLVANITSNETAISIGVKEAFNLSVAAITPYRWMIYTPYTIPYISCRQNMFIKNPTEDTEEVLQVFLCKAKYTGKGYISVNLETSEIGRAHV